MDARHADAVDCEAACGHVQQQAAVGSNAPYGFLLAPGFESWQAAARFVESLELFGIGYSWGGFESLAIPADPGSAG